MEHAASCSVPKALPPGLACGQFVQELPAGGAHHEGLQLHPGVVAQAAAHPPASHVARLGHGRRDVPPAAALAAGEPAARCGFQGKPILCGAAACLRAVAGGGIPAPPPPGAAAHRAAGAAESGAPGEGTGAAGAVPGPGQLGGGPGIVSGHLPVRAQAATDQQRRPAGHPGLHLDQDPGAGPVLSGGFGEGQWGSVLRGSPGQRGSC
mmetsp:Transcript_10685/g.32118  ORF Transcript_10685/g.32118 Transcript_10685/m.32118 type:complete len:208 (-) Transcript_10685:19-642(-)